ncbi:MAG: hypothetical protein JRI66_12315, partial [Deltaproteobacteria bacterium]|nr:hypothetical protein [Deltaproteobacteria bacterium]
LASAVTISGTFRGVWRPNETFGYLNARSAVLVKVVSGDGSVVRGVLLRVFNQTDTEWSGFRSRYCPPEQAVTPVDAQAGDRIVLELGGRYRPWGVQALDVYLGNTAAQDLDYTEGQTDQYNPWWEFRQDLPLGVTQGAGLLVGYQVQPEVQVHTAGLLVGYQALADLKHRKYPLINPKSKKFAVSPKRVWPHIDI